MASAFGKGKPKSCGIFNNTSEASNLSVDLNRLLNQSRLFIMHPFGREEETSRRELFGFFTRCLKRGEWELAAACVGQLGDARGDDPHSPHDIVKAIVTHPYPLRWETVGSPHRLAWYWLQVLEKQTEVKVSGSVKRELEFMLLLEELGDVPQSVLKELHEAFLYSEEVTGKIPGDSTPPLSAAVLSCLRSLLTRQQPRLCHSLISFLQHADHSRDHVLQDVFIQHLTERVNMPVDKRNEKWVEEVCSALALAPWGPERSNAQLETLWEGLWSAREGPMTEERILGCLLRPQGQALLTAYSSTALRLLREKLLREAPHTQVDLPDLERVMLGLCCHGDKHLVWKAIYFECLSTGKHFLEQVLLTGLDLIKREEFGKLETLLQAEFQPLSRLLLLLGWMHCQSLDSAKTLLRVLHHQQPQINDSVLSELACTLSSQLGVLEWCDQNKPGISHDALLSHLHMLDHHSALYVLHSLTPLAKYEEHRVLELLQRTGDPSSEDSSSSSVQRNINLFRGFCAMKYALYAICVNAHTHTGCLDCEPLHQQQTEAGQGEEPAEGCSDLFQHYLSECQLYLEAVPALFRLELLENIFSLLFLSDTDFSPQSDQISTGTETQPDTNTEKRKPNSIKSMSTAECILRAEKEGGKMEELKEEIQSRESDQINPELGHLTSGCRGFLVDLSVMEGILRLVREGLEGVCGVGQEDGRALAADVELAESLGCSVTAETFSARLQRLSKYTAEAQWRLQIVTSNHGNGNDGLYLPSPLPSPALPLKRQGSDNSCSGVRKKRRNHRHSSERHASSERQNGEVSTNTSDGGACVGAVCRGSDVCPCGGLHSWLVPAMLSPPESLLIACIRRGNYIEAQQVIAMYGLENSECAGELVFMDQYRDVLTELAQVEQKIESQSLSSSSSSSEGLATVGVAPAGRTRMGSSSRLTLQSIGSAAAAGMAFYSISDVAERLLSTLSRLIPCLEDNYWLSQCSVDSLDLVRPLLEELSPAAMAAFDLSCCQCQLWKTSRQLLETAERRLNSFLETRGVRVDSKVPHANGIRGFPSVLQQISKVLNRTSTIKGTNCNGEENAVYSPFGCSAQEVLLSCNSTLTEESIASRLNLNQRLEVTLQTLTSAANTSVDGLVGGSLLTALAEQAGLKQSELDSHPVRTAMKQLLQYLDQLCPFEPDSTPGRPDYIRNFLDYVNVLASVLVRSLWSEDQSTEVKLGNPLLLLLQSPTQLLSLLLFDRQVSPDRVLSLLQQERLRLSVQQVVVQRCCETLPLWDSRALTFSQGQPRVAGLSSGAFCPASIASILQQYAQECAPALDLSDPATTSDPSSESEVSVEDMSATSTNLSTSPPSPSSCPPSCFLLTPSALSFLKSRSPLVAALACLSASRGGVTRVTSSGWSGYFRGSGRKEVVLDGDQISKEGEALLKNFPILRMYLRTMAEPVLGVSLEADEGFGAALCGKPVVGMLFSGLQGNVEQAMAAEAFQQALNMGDLNRALDLLELYAQPCSQEGALRDKLLACTALQECSSAEQLFRVRDWELRGRVVLQGLDRWPLQQCLELLQFCLSDQNTQDPLREQLQQRKHELDMYQRMLSLQPALSWEMWQELREESTKNPESVFSLMLEAREFELCTQWVQLYSVSDQSRMKLQTEHLLYLLEQNHKEDAFQLLEALSDSVGLEVSERALDQRPGLAACHFLSDYLTLHFQSQMTPARRRHINALHLGSKVLLTLPEASRQDYFSLLSDPLLMLEQLLMNLKVDWVTIAISTLRSLLPAQDAGITNQHIDSLLAEYAQKALDFPYAPREWSRSDSVISLQDAFLQCPAQESCLSSPSHTPPPSAGSTPMHTPSSERRPSAKKIRQLATPFTPPEKTPDRKDWIPDHKQHICMVCQREKFTMFNRRHHCRRCGRLVCHSCSSRKMVVEGSEEPVRVCDQCYNFVHTDSDEEFEQGEVVGSPASVDGVLNGVLSLPEVPRKQYRLSPNPAENQQLKSEFYYEQAPSASLCVAILTLHSDHASCGQQLIGHCRSLSRKLTNPEVDARLLTDVMRQLLFSAKLMFVNAGCTNEPALCDSYISKVDVLKILVSANYKYIPSLDDIQEMTAVTLLRNQLLESEYYQLAVEVSTKSGLDPNGVWQAWGMASLKAGNLSRAREKFARCLKAPVDRNQLNHGVRLLQEIVQHLESTVKPTLSTTVDEDILASLRELEEALSDSAPLDGAESRVQQCGYFQECLFYLLTYGTHLSLISFYLRHDCLRDALTHLHKKECSEDVFLEGIFQPCLERGRLGALQGLLETLDSMLETWGRYLLSACQLLQRRGHYHSLYQLQQFMMDHVRAAMTCIRFFSHGAQSYLQLGEQQRWLIRAKEHLRTYLQEQQSRRKSHSSSFRKKMSSTDVSRHIHTIELQLEVTRFLHCCESSPSKTAVGPALTRNSAPPTLFGNSPMKVDVACKVMLGGKNIEEGFGIAYRVIQDFQLEALAVYIRVGQRLVRQRQYSSVRQLLKCVGESGTASKHDCDAIVLSCVSVADKSPADAKELEALILESKSPENKIKAYLQCRKLRAAYLQAVKLELVKAAPFVQDVMRAAESSGDSVMHDICRQWLSEHQEQSTRQRHSNN
ncbi:zinc finger FYVE domain-containing protein 26-like isoform X1 [Sinocyclocheilus rhinocerous]|uniref:zinc finger FYVE domain-containing protein 26-like isoform X1 n=1 Tax=Sinocyclocheilus rhinocerous TaxID=307959 RepID=UPI0007B7B91F|nr:PREDICTED: zinc finger FYVE domain-containing protein 26-like isoform X1 [Sinocyclocheilus rhinocerous]